MAHAELVDGADTICKDSMYSMFVIQITCVVMCTCCMLYVGGVNGVGMS